MYKVNMPKIEYKEYNYKPKIVWLDTNIIINIRDSLNKGANNKFTKLFELLKEKVKEEKIICPFSGQRSEYSQGNSIKESDDILIALSKGFQISTWKIHQEQVKTMIKNFLDNDTEFKFKDSDFMLKKKDKENDSEFKVVILTEKSKKLEREYLLKDLIRRKKEVNDLNLSYKDLLRSEQDGLKYALQHSINENIAQYGYLNLNFNIDNYWYHRLFTIIEIKNISETDDYKKIIDLTKKFLSSDYFYAIPVDKISSTIISNILIDKNKMTTNDIGDTENLSMILPYASFLITDSPMAHIIKSRKLDEEFKTKIYSIKDIDDFIYDIENMV